jgi:AraC family ethanolamine operon transcriptional activator
VSEKKVASGLYFRESFPLFEQMADAAQGWDLDFQQLSASADPCWLEQYSTEGMLYSRASFDSHFHQMGGPVVGFRTFALRAYGCSDFRWCDEAAYPNSLIVFPVGGQFESISSPGFDIFTVSLSNTLLARIAETEFQRSLSTLLSERGQICHLAGGTVRGLRAQLHRLSNDLGHSRVDQAESNGLFQEWEVEHVVARGILECLDRSRFNTPRNSRSKRMKALEKAIEIIRGQATDTLCISDLVSHTGVSRRTLESAFQDGVGVSPAAYLKATRLRALNRHLLQAARDESSVAHICQQHGFRHLGQLAADYRAMFGELPSVTLRR